MKKYGRDLEKELNSINGRIIKRYKFLMNKLGEQHKFMDPRKLTVQEMLNHIMYIEKVYIEQTNQIDMFDKPNNKKNV